jgi:hypothetical protein
MKKENKAFWGSSTLMIIAVVSLLMGAGDLGCAEQTVLPQTADTAKPADPLFNQPYIDIDEWREKPVRHRYVHGGFKGTKALFSFYFPPKEQYQGRFFQYVTPVPTSENLAQPSSVAEDKMGFAISSGIGLAVSSGAYLVETNEGSLSVLAGDQKIPGYRVNAAAAEYSRVLAAQMYGPHRPYGYAFGGSGGAFKTISGFENTETWDGAVPYVVGSPQAIPNVFTVRLLALRTLKDKFPSILDAIEPGGSGDMYRDLSSEERDTLREVTQLGFPPLGWFNYKTIGPGSFPVLFGGIRMMDHAYFEDFWKVPGYLGANPPDSLLRSRVQHKTTVKKVLTAGDPEARAASGGVDTAWQQLKAEAPVGFQLESVPVGDLEEAFLLIKSGDAAGKDLLVGRVSGNTVFIGSNPFAGDNSQVLKAIKAGDEVVIDNSDFLAMQYYHRYQVPTPDFYVWDQFRGPDGKPLYPQRPKLIGAMMTGAGSVQSGKFKGKMILLESMMDQDAFPWQADWYRSKVKAALGDHLDDNFRVWITERAIHGDVETQEDPTRTVSYVGVLQQALRDVSAWVEKGIAPPPSTTYKVVDGQIVVPVTAAERKGIQPVVHVTANGGVRASVSVDQTVTFSAVVEVPPGTGKIVAAEWDFEGEKTFPVKQQIDASNLTVSGTQVNLTITHKFSKSGTYFPALRATSQRGGDALTPYGRIFNLGRVRVVVK